MRDPRRSRQIAQTRPRESDESRRAAVYGLCVLCFLLQTIGDNCSTSSRAFTPSSAAGGIGPCLSTGEPDVAAASKRSTLARPRATAFHTRAAPRLRVRHSRCPAPPRSTLAWPRATAFQKLRAFTPSSAAGGIGPCLSTGEPDVPAASKRSTLAWPRAPAFHSRRPAPPRSTLASPRASAVHTRAVPRHRVPKAEGVYALFRRRRHRPVLEHG
jgi:hypothetical protein